MTLRVNEDGQWKEFEVSGEELPEGEKRSALAEEIRMAVGNEVEKRVWGVAKAIGWAIVGVVVVEKVIVPLFQSA